MSFAPEVDRSGPARIFAVVVTYEPDGALLRALFDALEPQVQRIYIVDNSEQRPLPQDTFPEAVLMTMQANVGIATAQNLGAARAFAEGATDVVFFDQDSEPMPGMIAAQVDARAQAERLGFRVAAVGPLFWDERWSNDDFPVRLGFRQRPARPWRGHPFCPVAFVIASGALISQDAWALVGGNEDGFFIDCVDVEWCFRAKSLGLVSLVALGARMRHQAADDRLRMLGRDVQYHSPLRQYYYYRNASVLLRRRYVPVGWKLRVSLACAAKFVAFSLFSQQGKAQAAAMTRGVWHGLTGRLGRLQA